MGPTRGTRSGRADLGKRWRRWRKKHGPEVLHRYRLGVTAADLDDLAPDRWPDAELRELDAELLDAMAAARGTALSERKRGILEGRIGHDTQTCWVILHAGEPAGYCHLSWTSTVNERISWPVRLRPTEVYLYDSHVFRPFRRRGLHQFSIARRLQLAAERGRPTGVTIISAGNTPSRASFRSFALRRTRTLLYLPPLRRTVSWPSRGVA